SVVEAVLLAPLPYRDADRLMWIWSNLDKAGYRRGPLSGPELVDLREGARTFGGLAAIWATGAQLTGDGEPQQLGIGLVTSNFCALLGAAPRTGRGFEPGDEGSGRARVVVLSDGLWRRRFGSDPGVVGRVARLNGDAVTVVGIAPPELRLYFPADASVPADLQAFVPFDEDLAADPRPLYFLRTIRRRAPRAPPTEPAQESAALGRRIEAAHPDSAASGRSFFAVPLAEDAVREVRPALLTVLGAVALVLVLACVNVANL